MKRVALLLAAGALGTVASVGVGHAAADDQAKVDRGHRRVRATGHRRRVRRHRSVRDVGYRRDDDRVVPTCWPRSRSRSTPASGPWRPLLENTNGDVEGRVDGASRLRQLHVHGGPDHGADTGVFDMGPARTWSRPGWSRSTTPAPAARPVRQRAQLAGHRGMHRGRARRDERHHHADDPEFTDVSLPDLSSMIPQIDVHATPDLGVGDASGRLNLGISSNMLGIPIDFDLRCCSPARQLARLHRLQHRGRTASTLDPQAELQAVVDALA